MAHRQRWTLRGIYRDARLHVSQAGGEAGDAVRVQGFCQQAVMRGRAPAADPGALLAECRTNSWSNQ